MYIFVLSAIVVQGKEGLEDSGRAKTQRQQMQTLKRLVSRHMILKVYLLTKQT